MNRTQKKRTATLMRSALEIEGKLLTAKGYMMGAECIREYLKTATDESLVTFADCLDEANQKAREAKRV